MARIVAGRFQTFDKANEVARHLQSQRIAPQDVSVFFVNTAGQHALYPLGGDQFADPTAKPGGRGALLGATVGAVVGLLLGIVLYLAAWDTWLVPLFGLLLGGFVGTFNGALNRMESGEPQHDGKNMQREAGVMVATRVDDGTASVAQEVLLAEGAQQVEQAEGVWEDGEWRDFDPRVPPNADAEARASFKA